MNIISFLYQLLFNQKPRKKNSMEPELFHSDNYLRPMHENIRKCPKCHIEAKTNKEALEIFGSRTVGGKPSIQSWCRKCRNDKNEKKNIFTDKQQEIDI